MRNVLLSYDHDHAGVPGIMAGQRTSSSNCSPSSPAPWRWQHMNSKQGKWDELQTTMSGLLASRS
jgi:hypothetical protein